MPETYDMQSLPKPIRDWIEAAVIHRAVEIGYQIPEMVDFDFVRVHVVRQTSGEVLRTTFDELHTINLAWSKEPATLSQPAPFAVFARHDVLETLQFQRLFAGGRIDAVMVDPEEVNIENPVPRVPVSGLVSLYPDPLYFLLLKAPPAPTVMAPCTSCGVQVSEEEALGDADTEWLCEGCFSDRASCVG